MTRMIDPPADEQDEAGHQIDRYVTVGALSGELALAWRCSCDGGRHCGVLDETTGEWRFGASPERHLASVRDDGRPGGAA